MQAKRGIGRILVIALIVSLVLGACGGGDTGSTWFNLPSVKLVVNPNGTANLYGFNLNAVVLQPAIITQLQTANIQRLEARAAYNGIHVYLNGEDMPYVSWDVTSTENLQGVIRSLPPGTMGTVDPNMVANLLPWLRKIGLGVKLELPTSNPKKIANWSGETAVKPESPSETTIGPITIASLVFDENGEAYIEGVAVSKLEQALGTTLPLRLDPNTLALLSAIGAESLRISTHPNGIDILMNEEPLPGIAYDSEYLARTAAVAQAFVTDPATLAMINELLPLLPGADITVVVSFTGEPVAETDLGSINLVLGADGMLQNVAGIPLPPMELLPGDVVGKLSDANVQQLGVKLLAGGLAVTANDKLLPTLSWSDDSLATMAALVGPIAGVSPDLVTEGLDMVRTLGADVKLSLPIAEGTEAIQIPDEISLDMKAPDLGDIKPPTIKLSAKYGDQGFSELGGLSAETLNQLGVTLPTLPPDLMDALGKQGISQLAIKAGDGALNVLLDGNTALTVNYDTDSLNAALDLAAPFMGADSPLNDPILGKFIREQILPIVPGANVDVTLDLE